MKKQSKVQKSQFTKSQKAWLAKAAKMALALRSLNDPIADALADQIMAKSNDVTHSVDAAHGEIDSFASLHTAAKTSERDAKLGVQGICGIVAHTDPSMSAKLPNVVDMKEFDYASMAGQVASLLAAGDADEQAMARMLSKCRDAATADAVAYQKAIDTQVTVVDATVALNQLKALYLQGENIVRREAKKGSPAYDEVFSHPKKGKKKAKAGKGKSNGSSTEAGSTSTGTATAPTGSSANPPAASANPPAGSTQPAPTPPAGSSTPPTGAPHVNGVAPGATAVQ